MKLTPLFAASLMALTSLSSQAVDYQWGEHIASPNSEGSGLTVTPFPPAPAAFVDKYFFTLSSASVLASSVSSFNIGSGTYSIWTESGGSTGYSWTYSGLIGTQNMASLSAGSYYYAVFGETTAVPGIYFLDSNLVSAAPVPEPETYAMLLAGLGVVGFVARRRRAD